MQPPGVDRTYPVRAEAIQPEVTNRDDAFEVTILHGHPQGADLKGLQCEVVEGARGRTVDIDVTDDTGTTLAGSTAHAIAAPPIMPGRYQMIRARAIPSRSNQRHQHRHRARASRAEPERPNRLQRFPQTQII